VAGVPLIITSKRALATHQDRYFILKYLDRMANRLSHHVTVNSQAVWNHTMERDGIDSSKLVLIYNGVDVDEFSEKETAYKSDIRKSLDIRENEKVVIVVANYIPYKGHSDFLKAAKLVCEKKTGVKFLLVGEDRGIQKHLEAESIQLGISPFVKFLGQRNDISELLLASDLSVLPSHEEGFSNVVLESMASALPMVATNVGGNAESILDGTTGWLVSPRKPKELATKILDLLNDPIKSKRWGQKGKERIKKHFSIEKTLKAHLLLYRS
jgi:glycosyltransferase involved in cell wall biosynthesis